MKTSWSILFHKHYAEQTSRDIKLSAALVTLCTNIPWRHVPLKVLCLHFLHLKSSTQWHCLSWFVCLPNWNIFAACLVFDGHFYDFENDSLVGGKVYGKADAENGFSSSFSRWELVRKSFEGWVYCLRTLINCAILSRSEGESRRFMKISAFPGKIFHKA